MIRTSRRCHFLLLAILLFHLAECGIAPTVVHIQPPRKVLFIGSSFTYFNQGIHHHFEQLAASASPPPTLTVSERTLPGATLKLHYEITATREAIHQGDWDVVILQGYSSEPLDELLQEEFVKYARLLNEEIQKAGAQTVFFMTWAYQDKPSMTEQLREAYVSIGNELEALVVPVGLAWERALKERPTLQLYSDNRHPTLEATYLSACVFYASLFGKSPVGLSYAASFADDEAKFFQRIAWETVRAFFRK